MFRNIKVGDVVIAHSWSGYRTISHKYVLCKVTKVNKKTFKVDKYPYKTFMLDYGDVYGDKGWERINLLNYDADFYAKKDAEQKENEKRENLLVKIGGIDYNKLTIEQLERIAEIVEESNLQEVG